MRKRGERERGEEEKEVRKRKRGGRRVSIKSSQINTCNTVGEKDLQSTKTLLCSTYVHRATCP
jgi:hypothetical protein